MTAVHICAPRPVMQKRMVSHCPTCKARRRMFGMFYEWYGWFITCLGCGEQWSDGEMLDRPFSPGWRKANIAEAKKRWAAA